MCHCEKDEMSERSECNVGCDSGFRSDSFDSEFHESDYDMEDDDDQGFEINVDLGIESDWVV